MSKKQLTIEERYKKKNPHEHILSEPDMYIGSVETDLFDMWIYNSETNTMIKKSISMVPGLYKIYDEILVNARDHTIRDKTCKTIKVNILDNVITVWNDGKGIPIEIHKDYNIYVPELIFGNLLSGENYDKKGKFTGGKNGLGAKLANIFSTEFIIETAEGTKKYIQKFENNMYKINPPIIDNSYKGKSYTKITFLPDYTKFGIKKLSDDIIALFKRRVYDLAGCTNKNVMVYLNDKQIKINTFEDYIKLFHKAKDIIYEEPNERWKVGVIFDSTVGFNNMSFVNGIWTYQGGTHVNHVLEQICKKLVTYIKTKHKNSNVKMSHVRDNITLFVDSAIPDPKFNSQTKDTLTKNISEFGSKCEISDNFITNLSKTGIVEEVIRFAEFKDMSCLNKSDGKKIKRIQMDKLEDAEEAGGRNSKYCRLFLTEGDSAKAFVVAGLSVIGRKYYGVFPLRGKPLNVRDESAAKIAKNQEFENIKKIMGLKQGIKYITTEKLRYGGIVICTDSDYDGSHIKGLLVNMFHYFWPSLLKIHGFIQCLSTPIVKVFKSNDKNKQNPKIFYTIPEYQKWADGIGIDINKWETKYYKGLGTSKENEARDCFKDFEKKVINYTWEIDIDNKENSSNCSKDKIEISNENEIKEDEKSIEQEEDDELTDINSKSYQAIRLGFSKDMRPERKQWLNAYKKGTYLSKYSGDIPISDFINKELINFSHYDNERSIPSIDGFKPSQRKVLYGSFRKKIFTKEIKVSQLANYVSEITDYHHGEQSLCETIINMAQDFIGSNNINLLEPNGNFGFRKAGGEEAASSRYIFTQINTLTHYIFRKDDENIYKHNYSDDLEIEPELYAPIIPMILVNGSKGIGTGFSTTIPSFNPKDIVTNILRLLNDQDLIKMKPWYRGFTGDIEKITPIKYITHGKYEIINEHVLRITELPIGVWTDQYTKGLENLLITEIKEKKVKGKEEKKIKAVKMRKDKEKLINNIIKNSGNNFVDITIEFDGDSLKELIKGGKEKIEDYLKLTSVINLSNMCIINDRGMVINYENTDDIITEFYLFRLKMYERRKEFKLKELKNDMDILKWKVQFIEDKLSGKIILERKKKIDVYNKLIELGYPKLSQKINLNEKEEVVNEEIYNPDNELDDNDEIDIEEKNSIKQKTFIKTYNYTDMSIYTLTTERLDKLKEELNKKKKEYQDYLALPIKDIWTKELTEFTEAYDKWLINKEKELKLLDKNKYTNQSKTKNNQKNIKNK